MPATRQKPNPGENEAKRKLEDPYDSSKLKGLEEAAKGPSYARPDPNETYDKLQGLEEAANAPSHERPAGQDPGKQGYYRAGESRRSSMRERAANAASGVFKTKKGKGGIAGLTIGGALFLMLIGQGPLELVQLSQILQKFSFGQEQTSSQRFKGLIRYWKSGGDIGETRVGYFASKSVKKVVGQLADIGVEFEKNRVTGAPNKLTVDTRKHPAFKDLADKDRLDAVKKHYGIPNSSAVGKAGAIINIDLDATSSKGLTFINSLIETSFSDLENGKVVTAMRMRNFKTFFGLPKLFSPLSKSMIAGKNKVLGLATRKQKMEVADEQAKPRVDATEERVAPIRSKIKPKIKPSAAKLAGGALVTTAALCLVRDIADDAVDLNYAAVVMPSLLEATDRISLGSQIQSGDNTDMAVVGAIAESLRNDEGESIWEAKSLNAVASDGAGRGKDIPAEYQQAFSNETTADEIKEAVGANGVSGVLCSPVGQIGQGLLGVGLLIAGPFTGGGSWAVFAAKAGAGAAASMGVMYFLQKTLTPLLADSPLVEAPLGGPVGGNLLAYGARAGAGLSARTSGGVEVGNDETLALMKEQEKLEAQDFQAKSTLAKIFDMTDHKSVASTVAHSINANPAKNITGIPDAAKSSFASIITPNTLAQEEEKPYDWGFPMYGIPKEITNNPKFDDPYENASIVGSGLEDGSMDSEKDRAEKCFGVKIEKGTNGWGVLAEKETNPADEEYVGSKCNDLSSENWKRMMLFTFDTRLITSISCFDGDEEACSDLDIEEVPEEEAASTGDAELSKTIEVSTPGKFITMPSHYSCAGRTTQIDSRIAASLAYLLDNYDMCADDGLANGHLSHGAGLGVDIRPKDQSKQDSKEEWKRTVEQAALDMGWWGDSATEGSTSKGCATYAGYGACVGGNGEIPRWVRWLGYNGDVDHGDPWHVYGGSYAHIHIGWATPNGDDATAASIIAEPVPAVLTFPAPVPDDLKGLVE